MIDSLDSAAKSKNDYLGRADVGKLNVPQVPQPPSGTALELPVAAATLPKNPEEAVQQPTDRSNNHKQSFLQNPEAMATKNKELEELARLIQATTGNINNILENSQQFMQTR